MKHSAVLITRVLPPSPLRSELVAFITREYERRMQLVPPVPYILFGAFRNKKAIGSVAIEFSTDDQLFQCEQLFGFSQSCLILKAPRSMMVQYSRWATSEPDVSRQIVRTATLYALKQQKYFGWCELKAPAAKRLRAMGIILYEVPGAYIRYDYINAAVLSYYISPPVPVLYQLDLEQMLRALS